MAQFNLKEAYDAVLARLDHYQPGTTDLLIERSLRQVAAVAPSRKPRIEAFREALQGPRYDEGPAGDDFRFDVWRFNAGLAFPEFDKR